MTLFNLPDATIKQFQQTCLINVDARTVERLQTEDGFYVICRQIAGDAMRKLKVSLDERRAYLEDWIQEAVVHLYDALFEKWQHYLLAYSNARGRVMHAIAATRYQKPGSFYKYPKQCWTFDGLVEQSEYFAGDGHKAGLTHLSIEHYEPSPYCADKRPRPVEDALIRQEEKAKRSHTHQWVEREVAKVLVAIHNRQWHPNSIERAAKIITRSGFGTPTQTLMREFNVSHDFIRGTLEHYRDRLNNTLPENFSPMFVALLRARGETMIQWWDDLSLEIINRGQRRTIVVMPYGAFTISYEKSPYPRARLQTGRRINGKPVNRSVNLGRLGSITYEKLFKGTHKIAEKMVELDTMAGNSTGYAAGLVANSYRGAMR